MYLDFHSKDVELKHDFDLNDYCSERNDVKQDWLPFLSFPITKKCNFHCLYCGSGGEATASNNEIISVDTIREYVTHGMERGLTKFRITGGEPFLHPQIDEILSFLDSTGCYILVNTNGSLIGNHKDTIEKLSSNVKFAVSFDTLKSERLEIISKVKCHEKIVENVRFLSQSGNLLRLNMVINKHNCDEVYDIIDFCQELKCDLKILDVVSVPVPFSDDRQDFYREVNSLEAEFAKKCDSIYSHEYSRGFGTPCYRYRFKDVYVTIKNSKKGSHYDVDAADGICKECKHYPCHEGLYDLFCLSDGRICSCRWTEQQKFDSYKQQMNWLIDVFRRSRFVYVGDNKNMLVREDLNKE